ncbi:MAG: hypothetical protein WHS86_10525 [Desulfosoma sp.]
MKKKRMHGILVLGLSLAVFVLCGGTGLSASPGTEGDRALPPMVTKHLLVPESNTSQGGAGPVNASRVTFTGILNTPKGTKALLETGAASKEGASPAGWYAVGDTVGPYVLKEIQANTVVLEGNGDTLRLPLYGPDKDRPQPVEVAAGPLDKGQIPQRGGEQAQGQGQEQQGQQPGPFGPAPKGAVQGKGTTPPGQTSPPAQSGGANPLQQAIEKARQGQGQGSTQGPFPPPQGSGSGSNPFMEILKKKNP